MSDFKWGQWILHERERKRWTQQELANRMGTTPLTISRWERGLSIPRLSAQNTLLELFAGQSEGENRHAVPLPAIYDTMIPSLSLWKKSLIGRDALLHRLKLLLCTHSTSFVLRGMYGAGKTALASTLAHDSDIQAHFSGGILWAGLGRNAGLLEVFSRWGTLLGLGPAEKAKLTSVSDWHKAIRDAIGQRSILIIIDDAWKAEDALAFKCGGVKCTYLLTTRSQDVAVAFTGTKENIFPVEELGFNESLELLEVLSPEIGEMMDDAKELVRSVGGLPLALTIIGRHIHRQGVSDQPRRIRTAMKLLHQAEQRLRLALLQPPSERPLNLSGDVPLSLHAAIEVSDQHLRDEARYALHVLSVFPAKPNSFSEEAALKVGHLHEEDLDTLVDTGLLESRGQGRYTLHQTIADYAHLHFRAGTIVQDPEAVEEQMVTYFVMLAEEHASDYSWLEQEATNVIAALYLARDKDMISLLMRGITALAPFLDTQGIYAVVEPCLQYVKQKASLAEEAHLIAKACFHLGRIAQHGKELMQAERYYEEGVWAARQAGDRRMLGELQAYWGEVIAHGGDHVRAEEHVQEALAITQELGSNPRRMGMLLRILGEVESCRGNNAKAIELFKQGLAQARQVSDYEIMSTILQNLGVDAERSGTYQQARKYYEEGLTYAQKARHQQRISAMLMNMGMLEFRQKQYEKAERLYLESLDIARKIQVPVRVSSALQNLGMLARARERYAQAARYLQESLDIAYQIGHAWLISETLYEWGELYLAQKNTLEAARALERALEVARDIQAKELIAFAEYGLARVSQIDGRLAEARQWGEKSLEDFQGTDNEAISLVGDWLKKL